MHAGRSSGMLVLHRMIFSSRTQTVAFFSLIFVVDSCCRIQSSSIYLNLAVAKLYCGMLKSFPTSFILSVKKNVSPGSSINTSDGLLSLS